MSVGDFAGGLARGITTGIEGRRRRAMARGLEIENARQTAIDENRAATMALPVDEFRTQTEVQGPMPDGTSKNLINKGAKLEEMRHRARLLNDEQSLASLNEMGANAAMHYVTQAEAIGRKGGSLEEQDALLSEAENILGVDFFQRTPDGKLMNMWGEDMADPRIRQGTYNWIEAKFRDAQNAGYKYGEEARANKATEIAEDELGIKQQLADLSEARFDLDFSNSMWDRQRIEREFNTEAERWEKEYNAMLSDLTGKNALRGAQAAAYLASAVYDNVRARAHGQEGVDPADALKYYQERVELSTVREHPLYESNPAFREQVGGLADRIIRSSGLSVSPEIGLSLAEAIVSQEQGVDDGSTFIDNGDGTVTLNNTKLPPDVSAMVIAYEQNKAAEAQAAANAPASGSGISIPDPVRQQQPGEHLGQTGGMTALGRFLMEYDWHAPGEKVRTYRERGQ